MKYLILFFLLVVLTGCGGVNQWNHSKLKKVRVKGTSREIVDQHHSQHKLTLNELDFQANDSSVLGSQEMEEVKTEKFERSISFIEKKKEALVPQKKQVVSLKSSLSKPSITTKGQELKGFSQSEKSMISASQRVDWEFVGEIAILVAIGILLLLGWIFFPNLTAFVIALAQLVLLIVVIVMFFKAIGWLLSAMFS